MIELRECDQITGIETGHNYFVVQFDLHKEYVILRGPFRRPSRDGDQWSEATPGVDVHELASGDPP